MASAVLPSRNEQKWSGHGGYLSKLTSNKTPNLTRFNPNPNCNPNPSQFFTNRDVGWKNHGPDQELPSSTAPPARTAFAGSSINFVPEKSNGRRYVTYRLGSYTRRELKELRKRLISDLDRVRILRHRISSPTAEEKISLKRAMSKKRTAPFASVRDAKRKCHGVKNNGQMKKCGQILGKLMKHKHGWVFNIPVDAAALKLYDYHSIIRNPMDLGTIKSKLAKNEYDSPISFAADVRLTFQNAMIYNGRGSDVYVMAELLLSLFEDMFKSAHQKLAGNQIKKQNRSITESVTNEETRPNTSSLKPMDRNLDKAMASGVKKQEMTVREKAELATRLSNLEMGPEGMDRIMKIVKKGVLGMAHEGDEIELDLEVLDNETLWELDGFIRSSNKKAEEMMITKSVSPVQAHISEHLVEEHGQRAEEGEEDIDIGEDIPVTNFQFVEIEKDAVNVSSSSSSSSSSDSSSSDSDSDSSAGDDDLNEQKEKSAPKGGF